MDRHDEPYWDLHERLLALLARMSPSEKDEILRRAGVLDPAGHLVQRFVPPTEVVREQMRLAAMERNLKLHSSVLDEHAPWYVTEGDSVSGHVIASGATPREAVDQALATFDASPSVK